MYKIIKSKKIIFIFILITLLLIFLLLLEFFKQQEYKKNSNNQFNYEALEYSDFYLSKPGLPSYIKKITGLSFQEKWGRWSEHSENQSTAIIFQKPLPRNFILKINIIKFYNKDQSISIAVGSDIKYIELKNDNELFVIKFNKVEFGTDSIIITPKNIFNADIMDPRKIGFGISFLKLEAIN